MHDVAFLDAQLGRAPTAPNSTLVVMWTQTDGGGAWATDAAAELVAAGLFDDPDAAELSLVAFGDAYVDNAYSCEMGGTWTAAAAACWLANCSEPWPPAKGMTSGDCYVAIQRPASPCASEVRASAT